MLIDLIVTLNITIVDIPSSCEFHGQSYEDGESWQNDCNVCDCNHGNTQCTQVNISCGF